MIRNLFSFSMLKNISFTLCLSSSILSPAFASGELGNKDYQLQPRTRFLNADETSVQIPLLYLSSGQIPRGVDYKILEYVSDPQDINSLALVSKGLCNWVDRKIRLKVKSINNDNELFNILKYKTNIRILDLSECSWVDVCNSGCVSEAALIKALASCSSVTSLFLAKITNKGIGRIAPNLFNLNSLSIKWCFELGDESLGIILSNFKNLAALSLTNCGGISDRVLLSIKDVYTQLKSLEITECSVLTDEGARVIPTIFPDLTTLRLIGCELLTGRSSNTLNYKGLISLNLNGCKLISDEGLHAFTVNCKNLSSLSLENCQNITDAGLSGMAADLRSLNLNKCSKLSDEVLFLIGTSYTRLKSLSMNGCKKITEKGLVFIAAHCLDLTSLDLEDGKVRWMENTFQAIIDGFPSLISFNIQGCFIGSDTSKKGLKNLRSMRTGIKVKCSE